LELGVRSQEPGEKRKKEEGRSQKKCFYKYEMLPIANSFETLAFIRAHSSLTQPERYLDIPTLTTAIIRINTAAAGINTIIKLCPAS
jgi:hypothetical protein